VLAEQECSLGLTGLRINDRYATPDADGCRRSADQRRIGALGTGQFADESANNPQGALDQIDRNIAALFFGLKGKLVNDEFGIGPECHGRLVHEKNVDDAGAIGPESFTKRHCIADVDNTFVGCRDHSGAYGGDDANLRADFCGSGC
jgi:hypothetical protein